MSLSNKNMKNLVFFYALLISSLLITSCKKDFEFREVNTKKNNTDSRVLNTALLYKVYYVSPAGNDNNDGTSTATPWQTLTKVNAQIFAPGDQVEIPTDPLPKTLLPLTTILL